VYVAENLNQALVDGADLFLICGKVAQATYDAAVPSLNFILPNVIRMDHPAARRWTNEKLDAIAAQIRMVRDASI
jgi:hypothetical protein